MKRILFAAVVALTAINVCAQESARSVVPVEGSVYVGASTPLRQHPGLESCSGIELGVEFRYNLRKLPMSVGMMIDAMSLPYVYSYDNYYGSNENYGGLLLGATADWNFRRARLFSPFAGASTGVGFLMYDGGDEARLVPFIRPRIGFELFHFLRFSNEITISHPNSCGVSFTLGFVIGGWPTRN